MLLPYNDVLVIHISALKWVANTHCRSTSCTAYWLSGELSDVGHNTMLGGSTEAAGGPLYTRGSSAGVSAERSTMWGPIGLRSAPVMGAEPYRGHRQAEGMLVVQRRHRPIASAPAQQLHAERGPRRRNYTEKRSSLSIVLRDHGGVELVSPESHTWGELCKKNLASRSAWFSLFSSPFSSENGSLSLMRTITKSKIINSPRKQRKGLQ